MCQSEPQNEQVNLFTNIIYWLEQSTSQELLDEGQIQEEELQMRIEFAASYVIMLREQGRLQVSAKEAYNMIIQRYIQILARSLNAGNQQYEPVEILIFYATVGLLGADEQIGCLCDILRGIRDDSLMSRFITQIYRYFRPEAAESLYHYLIRIGVYGQPEGRLDYQRSLETQFHHQPESIEVHDDLDSVRILRWSFKATAMHQQSCPLAFFTRTIASYVELIKKFMIEGKMHLVSVLFKDYLELYINQNAWIRKLVDLGGMEKSLPDLEYYLDEFCDKTAPEWQRAEILGHVKSLLVFKREIQRL